MKLSHQKLLVAEFLQIFLHYYKIAGNNNNPAILFYCIVSTSFPYLLR